MYWCLSQYVYKQHTGSYMFYFIYWVYLSEFHICYTSYAILFLLNQINPE